MIRINGWIRLWVVLFVIWFLGCWSAFWIKANHSYYQDKAIKSVGSTLGLSHDEEKLYWALGGMEGTSQFKQIYLTVRDLEYDWLNRLVEISIDAELALLPVAPSNGEEVLALYPIQPDYELTENEAEELIKRFIARNNLPTETTFPFLLRQHEELSQNVKVLIESESLKFTEDWNKDAERDLDTIGLMFWVSLLPPLLLLLLAWVSVKVVGWVREGFNRQ